MTPTNREFVQLVPKQTHQGWFCMDRQKDTHCPHQHLQLKPALNESIFVKLSTSAIVDLTQNELPKKEMKTDPIILCGNANPKAISWPVCC